MESRGEDTTIFNEAEEDDILYTDESKPEFLLEGLTLDEIIQLKRAEKRARGLENGLGDCGEGGIRFGMDDTSSGISRLTPVFLLRLLSEDGKLVEMEAKELEIGHNKVQDFRARRWQIVWTHGGVKGVGEAPRKMMAMQVAALDLVEKLRNKFPIYNLPECEVPPGSLVSPFLFKLLVEKCGDLEYGPPEFQLKASLNFRGKKEFTSFCYVEDEVFVGKSYDCHYAKRFAAKKAYEYLVDSKYPDDKVIRGEQCSPEDNYNLIESEAHHVYFLYKRPEKRLRLSTSFSSIQKSRAESLASIDSMPTIRPPRLRPPPVIVPPNLKMHLPLNTSRNHMPQAKRKLGVAIPETVCGDEESEAGGEYFDSLEVEAPSKYGALSDDDDEVFDVRGIH